ncbi:lon protease-like protein, mitochondrial-like [Iris pallida]|uniref:Lon protease-like protein, mitochondrial-like n=1 Tax=Iris pallida TaxID=29817 RepID=A0AAX6DV28_IRIPA|nr:lon protease-like protein, mitochondrial-like [Iris pallida]
MLKVLSSSSRLRLQTLAPKFPPKFPNGGEARSPLLRLFDSLRRSGCQSPSFSRAALFCSESGDGAEKPEAPAAAEGGGAEEADSKASSAIVSMNPRPEDYLTVLALPLPHRPLFPGFYMPIYIKDPKLLAALVENRKRSITFAGAFLLKDEPGTDPSIVSPSETEKSIHALKGKEMFKRLHEVGTLAQISSINDNQVVLVCHRRLRITEMVDEDPLTVKVDHLKA